MEGEEEEAPKRLKTHDSEKVFAMDLYQVDMLLFQVNSELSVGAACLLKKSF